MLASWITATRTFHPFGVFRDLDFHFAFQLRQRVNDNLEPRAVSRLDDGRLLVAYAGDCSGVALFTADGSFLSNIAEHGAEEGCVLEPSDMVVEAGRTDASTRVVVADLDGERVQVLTLAGRCYGQIDVWSRS